MWEDGRRRGGLGAVAVAGWGRGASAGRGSQLVDVGETCKARDPVGALGLEAALGGMLLVAGVMGCGSGVTAVAVLDGSGGESGEGGRCRGGCTAGGCSSQYWLAQKRSTGPGKAARTRGELDASARDPGIWKAWK